MRFIFMLLVFTTSLLHAQLSNVRQTIENGRTIITYDLGGSGDDVYNISVTATNESGLTVEPVTFVGDFAAVSPGLNRSIWWDPLYEGLSVTGWKIHLTAKKDIGIKWILVEGGLRGKFKISATEVTFDQFDAFCRATGYPKPTDKFGRGKQPVINVNVADAVAFCEWLSKETGTTIRLPEENEWEYAARGGNKSKGYNHSGSNNIDEVAWYSRNSGRITHEVATKMPNELGIYDMSGNVSEWCGTAGASRGGSWLDADYNCDVSSHRNDFPVKRYTNYGFRVLQE